MCGLVAISSVKNNGFTLDEGRMFEQSMVFNQLRGEDSTGVVSVDRKDTWSFMRAVGGWRSLTKHNQFDGWRQDVIQNGRLAFGHGRWATRGIVSVENAHPFYLTDDKNAKGEIVFMHNGTLSSHQTLPGFALHDVDSEYLGKMIVVHGAEEALSKVNGAIACMWWDCKENTFNIYRNYERPLFIIQLKDGEFILNSERWILEYLVWRYKLKVEDKEIKPVTDNTLFYTKINGKETGEWKSKKITRYNPPVQHYRGGEWVGNEYDRVHGINYRRRGGYERHVPYWPEEDSNDWGQIHYNPPPTSANPPAEGSVLLLPAEDKEFWDRQHECIEWINGDKVITFRDRTKQVFANTPPTESDLLRMYENKQNGNVVKVYKPKKEGDRPIMIECKYSAFMANKAFKLAKDEDKKEKFPVLAIQNGMGIKGKELKFSTRLSNNKKVKHRGVIDREFPHLGYYENSVDGDVCVGEVKNIEVILTEVKELKDGKKLVRVVGSEVKDQQDSYIDYQFFTGEYDEEKIKDIRFFKGIVGSIRVASTEQHSDTGGIVICALTHVKAIVQNKEEDATPAAATEAAPQAAAGPTVH